MDRIVIIGNGISGITAARFIRKNSDAQITIISSESHYFFSRTALMYVFMGQLKFEHTEPYERDFYEKNRLNLVFDRVETIDFNAKMLFLKNENPIHYDQLILALGSTPNKLNVTNEDLSGIQGLYSKQDLDLIESKRNQLKKAVIIGGGLIGVELAEMLHYQGLEVDFLIRESSFWGNVLSKTEGDFISKHLESKGIRLQFNQEAKEFEGNQNVEAVVSKTGTRFEADFVGIAAGVRPNISFVKNTELETNRGILIDQTFQTNIPDVFAIGDCAEFRNPVINRKSIEQVWYTGKEMGKVLGENIGKGNQTKYNPGPWFNSAKFFDIEYQNYGVVLPEIESFQSEFIWQKDSKLIRIIFHKETEVFIGINAFGIRLRHEVFDYWLGKEAKIDEVLSDFKTANFDPEFYRKYESEIVQQFNSEFNKNIELKKKKWYQNLIKA